jgi:hypothetical protein
MPVARHRKEQRGFAGLASLALAEVEAAEAPPSTPGPWGTVDRTEVGDREKSVKGDNASEKKVAGKQSAPTSTELRQSEPISRGNASAVIPPSTFKRNVAVVCCLLVFGVLLELNSINMKQTTQTPQYGSNYPVRNDVQPTIPPTPPVSSSSETQVEAPPWKGDGTRRLTIAMIRWCLFQQRRITYLREKFDNSGDEVDASTYNNMVDDYSDRCASFQYVESDMKQVRSEVASKEPELKVEAARIWASWLRPREQVALDLLRMEDAKKVQQRLIALKYLVAPADGLWTSRSRSALREFKIGNGLPHDDLFDETTGSAVFSPSAVKKLGLSVNGGGPKETSEQEARYPPPAGATLNPLNSGDAIILQKRLSQKGYFKGKTQRRVGPRIPFRSS